MATTRCKLFVERLEHDAESAPADDLLHLVMPQPAQVLWLVGRRQEGEIFVVRSFVIRRVSPTACGCGENAAVASASVLLRVGQHLRPAGAAAIHRSFSWVRAASPRSRWRSAVSPAQAVSRYAGRSVAGISRTARNNSFALPRSTCMTVLLRGAYPFKRRLRKKCPNFPTFSSMFS